MTANNSTPDSLINRFAEIARSYCAWAEGELGDPVDKMLRLRLLLAELHLAALRLPEAGPGKNKTEVSIPHDEWARYYKKFQALPVREYFDVFNPLRAETPVENSLADDLADIYRDVKAGLSLFEANYRVEAAWEWRFLFQHHWGPHLVGAQRAIHEFLTDERL